MSDRLVTLVDRRAVYALLDRMLDWLPPTRLALAKPEPSAHVKPGEGRWVRCGRCAGEGRVTGEGAHARACRQRHDRWPYSHGCRPCLACAAGWVRLPIVAGQPLAGVDPMLNPGKSEFATAAAERSERRRWVDGQLVRLAALERQHAGVEAADDEHTRAHAAKKRLYGSGSFAHLELAMDALAIQAPLRHAAVVFFVVEQQLPPDPPVQARLDESVDWVAVRMPRPILLPADAAAEVATWKHTLEHGRTPAHRVQREARNREIVELVTVHGWSLRRVGRLYDMTHEGVRRIVAQTTSPVATAR